MQIYGLGQTPHEIRHIIGLKFRKHSHVRDPRIIEMLIAKGEMEMEETMMQWSQRGHVVGTFSNHVYVSAVLLFSNTYYYGSFDRYVGP